jgi:hypothetical protein
LSAFDKVLGGLAWAIAGSAVDIDVDVFFDDNATLGVKNKCAETVCRALVRMKCPAKLQSYQISRQEWKAVHPAVVWVIKTVLETREERQKQMRKLAVYKSVELAADVRRQATREASKDYLGEIEATFGPQRKFKQKEKSKISKDSERVLNVLREYGTVGGAGSEGGEAGLTANS